MKRVAVLELDNPAKITEAEANYLTDKVRDAASKILAPRGFFVVSRESIEALLPPDMDLKKCTSTECVVDIGRKLQVDYIVNGEILKYAGEFRANLKAHHSASGAFLGASAAEGADLKTLERSIASKADELFSIILDHSGSGSAAVPPAGGRIGGKEDGEWQPPASSKAIVRFECEPKEAVVLVNGKVECQGTPCSREIPEGAATVSMQAVRYRTQEQTVTIRSNMKPISWKLKLDFGWLSVESTPPGLPVKINGKDAGATPIKDKGLDSGNYEVVISHPLYVEEGERFTLSASERKTLSFKPKPREGAIQVSARDAAGNALEADVYVDGQKAGRSPGTFKALIGPHDVEARTAKGAWKGKAEVAERQVAQVTALINTSGASTEGMVYIKGGSFLMGCSPGDSECFDRDWDGPPRTVSVDSFWMDKTEITQSAYQRCISAGRCNPVDEKACWKMYDERYWLKSDSLSSAFKGNNQPVVCVNWIESDNYCRWSGKRLPSDAEWMYAARGGTTVSRYGELDSIAWYKKNSGNVTHPVAQKQPNAYGLYDMLGNVWEWTSDWSGSEQTERVLRGGGWIVGPERVRTSYRGVSLPSDRDFYTGFRCVRDD